MNIFSVTCLISFYTQKLYLWKFSLRYFKTVDRDAARFILFQEHTLCHRWNFHDYYRHRFSCVFVASLYRERFCVSIYELIRRVKNCLQSGCVCVCMCERERERESAFFVYIYERFPFFVRCTFRFFTTRVMTNFAGLILFFYGIILLRPLPSPFPKILHVDRWHIFHFALVVGKKILTRVALYNITIVWYNIIVPITYYIYK